MIPRRIRRTPSDGHTVVNLGVAGDNTADLIRRFPRVVKSHSPDLIAITVGTNDALNSSKTIGVIEFEKNISILTELAREVAPTVVFIIPPPCHDPYVRERHPADFFAVESPSERLGKYSEVLRTHNPGDGVVHLDINTHFVTQGSVGLAHESWIQNEQNSGLRDGVHPTPRGYREIAELLHDLIKAHTVPCDRVVCFGDSITFGAGASNPGESVGESYPAVLNSLLNLS